MKSENKTQKPVKESSQALKPVSIPTFNLKSEKKRQKPHQVEKKPSYQAQYQT